MALENYVTNPNSEHSRARLTEKEGVPGVLYEPLAVGPITANSRKMTSFVGAMAKLGAGVDNELG